MKDKPIPFAELFGAALQNLGDAIIQSVDEALLASRGPASLELPPDDEDARAFAERHAIGFVAGRELARSPQSHNLARAYDPAHNACVDFSRCLEHIPAFVLTPASREALLAALGYVRERGLPLRVRGAALACGGQTLGAGAAVIDLRGLDAIALSAQTDGEPRTVRAASGATWQRLEAVLAPLGLAAPVAPLHTGATLGGTLAAGGGLGEASHALGRAVDHVVGLELAAADGSLLEVAPGDPRFELALGSLGQEGVIVSATLATVARPSRVAGMRAGWESVAQFVDDAISLLEDEPSIDVLLARRAWDDEFPVVGTVGLSADAASAFPRARLRDLNAELEGAVEVVERAVLAAERWAWLPAELCAPALEIALPLPQGLRTLRRIEALLDEARLLIAMPRGAQLFVTSRATARRGTPLPSSEHTLHVQLRPLVRQHRVRHTLRALEAIAAEVLAAGGTLGATGSQALFAGA